MWHANRFFCAQRHINIFSISSSTVLFHTVSYRARISGGWGEIDCIRNVCFLFIPTNLIWNISHFRKNLARSKSKLNFLDKLKKNLANTKFHENLSSGSLVTMRTDGRVDRHDEGSSRLSLFYERRLKTESVTRWYSNVMARSVRSSNITIHGVCDKRGM